MTIAKRILKINKVFERVISSVSAEENDVGNFSDSNTLDDEPIISARDGSAGSFNDLKNLVDQANDGDIMNLDKDYILGENEKDDFVNGIPINKDITINGNNYTLDCNHFGRVFYVTNSLILLNVNIINGYAGGQDGAAIYNIGSIDIINCSFHSNYADKEGGAISTYNFAKIENCTFDSNGAGDRGGAIYCAYGDVNITNSVFTNNRAYTYGGAISILSDAETVISNSTFTGNVAETERGGAIRNNGGKLTIIQSNFNENEAHNLGGAVSSFAGAETTVIESNFNNNTAGERGGALYSEGHLNVSDSSFVNNTADYGGAISNQNNAISIILNSTFRNNSASHRGGAIRNNAGYLTINGSTFENNRAVAEYGGAVSSFAGAETTVIESNFNNNTAGERGGALYTEGALNVSDSNFINNKADYGGAISNQNSANSTITNSTFKNNSASSRGGAIRNNGGHLGIYESTFEDNRAVEYGGAVSSFTDSTTDVYDSIFIGNSAGDRGGAIRNGGNLVVINSTFEHNNATNYGGAVSNYVESNATIINSTFKSNNAESGGAIGTNGKLDITNSKFSNNSAKSGGAVTALDNVTVDINNSVFNDNIAVNGSVFRFEGENADVKIENNSYKIIGSNAPIFVNKTIINSNTTVVIMNNETIGIALGDNLNLTAVVIIDGQLVYGYNLEFVVNGTNYPADSLYNGTYYAPFSIESSGNRVVNITNMGIKENLTDIKTATLRMKEDTQLIISSDDITYGENATINIILKDKNGTGLTGTVTITVNGKKYNVEIVNGIGSIVIPGLSKDTYSVEGNFAGNIDFNPSFANTTFKVIANEDNSTDIPNNESNNDNNDSIVEYNDEYSDLNTDTLASTNIRTGNPLVLLVLALFSLVCPITRRK